MHQKLPFIARCRFLILAVLLAGAFPTLRAETWYLFDSYVADGEARATFSEADADGWYTATFNPTTTGARCLNFVFSNSSNPNTDADTATFLGSASNNSAPITVTYGQEYTLYTTTRDNAYGDKDCFEIDKVDWVIRFNPTTMKVQFNKPPLVAPETLYVVDYNKSFGSASRGDDGTYVFTEVTLDDMSYPYYGFANKSNPSSADFVLGPDCYADGVVTTSKNNVKVVDGETYKLVESSQDNINAEKLSFDADKGPWNIVLDWDAMTVTFSKPVVPFPDAPQTLYLTDYQSCFAEAENNGEGIFVFDGATIGDNSYPYYGFTDTQNPRQATVVLGPDTGDNVTCQIGETYGATLSNWDNVNECVKSFVINNGVYDITVNWNEKTITFAEHVIVEPDFPEAPEKLWVVDYTTDFGEAENDGTGKFRFKSVTLNDSSYPYYGFANNASPTAASVVVSAVYELLAQEGVNVEVELDQEYELHLSSQSLINAEYGSFKVPVGTYDILLDWNAKTVVFSEPVLDIPAKLVATDTYLETIYDEVADNGTGVFTLDVNIEARSLLVFTNSTEFRGASTIYYGATNIPGGAYNVENVAFDTEYALGYSSYNQVWGDETGFRLNPGRYRVIVNFPERSVKFYDISRGDIWTIPETVAMYDDNFTKIADGTKTDDGVFTFTNVTFSKESTGFTNVVFTDNPTAEGKIFGANMTGDYGLTVKNRKFYDLYIPRYEYVMVDGASCFSIPDGTWNITVDFNEKNVYFFNPEAPYYPDAVAIVVNGTAETAANGNGVYTWTETFTEASTLSFADTASSVCYGAAAEATEVKLAEPMAVTTVEGITPNTWNIAAGTYEMQLDVKNGTFTVFPYTAITFSEASMKDGDTFYSYFGAGTDSRFTMYFNGQPYTCTGAILALGDYTPGMTASTEACTIEEPSIYRSGNTFFVDFGGVSRSIPEGATNKTVTLVVTNIKGVNGLVLDTPAIDGLAEGSLMFTFNFAEYERVTIESKLNDNEPASTEPVNVDNDATVTLWLKPFNLLTFSDVVLTPVPEEEDAEEAPRRAAATTVTAKWTADPDNTDADGFTPVIVEIPMKVRGTGSMSLTLSYLDVDDNAGDHGDEVNYTIVSNVHPADVVTADPASGSEVSQLSAITLTWTHALVSSVGYDTTVPEVTVTDAEGNEVTTGTLNIYAANADNEITVDLAAPIIEKGTYTVTIPADAVILNDDPEARSRAITLNYSVDGSTSSIDSILAGDPDCELAIYNMMGQLLHRGPASRVLKNLSSGFYIINGKKVKL